MLALALNLFFFFAIPPECTRTAMVAVNKSITLQRMDQLRQQAIADQRVIIRLSSEQMFIYVSIYISVCRLVCICM